MPNSASLLYRAYLFQIWYVFKPFPLLVYLQHSFLNQNQIYKRSTGILHNSVATNIINKNIVILILLYKIQRVVWILSAYRESQILNK